MLAYLVAKGEPVKLGTCKTKLEDQADHISTTWLTPDRFDIVSYQCCTSSRTHSLLSRDQHDHGVVSLSNP